MGIFSYIYVLVVYKKKGNKGKARRAEQILDFTEMFPVGKHCN